MAHLQTSLNIARSPLAAQLDRPSTSAPAQANRTVDRLPLSSYKFPQIPSGRVQPTSLENAVKDAVVHLDQAPFLQLQRGQQVDRHSVDDRILNEPQLWRGVAGYLRENETELVLLVHPLESPAPERSPATVPTSGEVMTGITNASHQHRLSSFAELVRSGATTADFSGRVGECCDEEETHSQVVPFPRKQSHARRPETSDGCSESDEPCSRQRTPTSGPVGQTRERAQYWGVVLQSRTGAGSGCFVLKTSHSAVGDCTCIHWSLTRVCRGAPLFDQVNSAWLLS